MTRPTLMDLTAFTKVAEQRSFRKAADLLGVSRSSLSHAIASLEKNLGACYTARRAVLPPPKLVSACSTA